VGHLLTFGVAHTLAGVSFHHRPRQAPNHFLQASAHPISWLPV
jgi:hypothetical protein